MDSIEFMKICKLLYAEYKVIFGTKPNYQDYNTSRSEYVDMLKKSIELKIPIDELLAKETTPNNPDALI